MRRTTMGLALAPLLVALALAGCAAETPPPEPTIPPTAPPQLLFGPDIGLPQAFGGAEPNIAVTPDGTLFLTVPVGGSTRPNVHEGSAYLWRSTDGGATWQTLRSPDLPASGPEGANPQAPLFCSCDADVVASPDGWVYYSDWWISGAGLGPGNYLVEASNDNGQTWRATAVTAQQDLPAGMDRQWLVAGPDGYVAIYYSFFSSTAAGSIPVPFLGLDRPGQALNAIVSHDHGETWSDPVAVVPASESNYQVAHPRITPDGTVWMPYGAVKPGDDTFWRNPSEVRVVVTEQDANVQSDVLVATAPEGFDNLWAVQGAHDPDTDRAYVVWAARVDDDHSAIFLSWSDDLATWSPPHQVIGQGVHVLPWADARFGNLTLGWYGGVATGDPVEAPASAEWFAYAAEWRAGFPVTLVSPVHVSGEPVKTGPFCPRGASCNGERELLDYVSMVYAPDGRVHYAFARSDGADAFVRVAIGTPTAAQPSYNQG